MAITEDQSTHRGTIMVQNNFQFCPHSNTIVSNYSSAEALDEP